MTSRLTTPGLATPATPPPQWIGPVITELLEPHQDVGHVVALERDLKTNARGLKLSLDLRTWTLLWTISVPFKPVGAPGGMSYNDPIDLRRGGSASACNQIGRAHV